MNWIKNLFRLRSAIDIAKSELEEAERQLLKNINDAEYFTTLAPYYEAKNKLQQQLHDLTVAYYQQKIARLRTFISLGSTETSE